MAARRARPRDRGSAKLTGEELQTLFAQFAEKLRGRQPRNGAYVLIAVDVVRREKGVVIRPAAIVWDVDRRVMGERVLETMVCAETAFGDLIDVLEEAREGATLQ